ncbi:zinc metallochaperone AztD [Streptomyces sp. DSM 42041]|uniref:Zinc metallochaperone AztD n=1 Tax=Streptomyces hazeniae TaxID=3075538 RepID=A0ABU2NQJ0_9ACTN|nr:zinc metallochaperone AztD [Streptomyces sp. DSM 42041]MDT0379242.1 zinc metallochaperone AztD [Streptomyces sp. DSM 42041]
MRNTSRPALTSGVTSLLAASLLLTACGSGSTGTVGSEKPEKKAGAPASVEDPVVVTYDGGLLMLDGQTLKAAEDIALDGYNRVNPAGDDRHVIVSTEKGFSVLDAVAAAMTDVTFPGEKPGHVVRHAGRTVLFTDGTGEVTAFDPGELADGEPKADTFTSKAPHHGVAVELENGALVSTVGTEEEGAVGIQVLDVDGKEIARSEECPGAHGEATAKDEAVAVGCEDGVLLYADGKISKIDSPSEYGAIGTQKGSDQSAIILGDYKKDADAERERPEQVSLVDTETKKLDLLDLGTSYSFRSLARGPHGEGLVLGTDGKLHVLDMEKGEVTDSVPVVGAWKEPLDWQEARPALFVRDHTAYVTDPATKKIHAVDFEAGEVTESVTLPHAPDEISGVHTGHHEH